MTSDDIKFVEWLQNRGLSRRSARDVRCRLARAEKYYDKTQTQCKYKIASMEENSEFKELSTTVRSQLRRALKLYSEYKRSTDNN